MKLWFRVGLLLLFGWAIAGLAAPVLAADSPEALYDRAQNAYLEFKTDKAANLLHQILKRDPDHEKARELLDEMGREVPDYGDLEAEETESETSAADTGTSGQKLDTGPNKPSSNGNQAKSSGSETTDTRTKQAEDTAGETTSRDRPSRVSGATDNVGADTDRGDTGESADRAIVVPEGTDRTTSKSMNVSTGPSSDTIGARAEDQLIAPIINVDADTVESEDTRGLVERESSPGLRTNAGDTTGEALLTPEDVEPSDNTNTPQQTFRSNLNTASRAELSNVFDSDLVNQIIEQREADGYYLGWSDFDQRIDISENQFQTLRDEFRLAIPVVNINTASVKELAMLPYITSSMAANIVNFRFTYGSFRSVDELTDVPGIEEPTLKSAGSFLEAR